jgi:hypothetical protein
MVVAALVKGRMPHGAQVAVEVGPRFVGLRLNWWPQAAAAAAQELQIPMPIAVETVAAYSATPRGLPTPVWVAPNQPVEPLVEVLEAVALERNILVALALLTELVAAADITAVVAVGTVVQLLAQAAVVRVIIRPLAFQWLAVLARRGILAIQIVVPRVLEVQPLERLEPPVKSWFTGALSLQRLAQHPALTLHLRTPEAIRPMLYRPRAHLWRSKHGAPVAVVAVTVLAIADQVVLVLT